MGVGCERNGVKVQGGSWKALNCNSEEKKRIKRWVIVVKNTGSRWFMRRLKLQQQEKKNQDINNSL
jgi:hypothetical protein